jgi:hypothetical protein
MKYSDITTWSFIKVDSEYVTYIDTNYCTTFLSGALKSYINDTTPFWTDYGFCNSVYAPSAWEFTGFVYPKFYATDSLRVFAVVPRPYPYMNRIHYLFLGVRVSADYTIGNTETKHDLEIKIFPSPAIQTVHIVCPESEIIQVTFYNLLGKQIMQKGIKNESDSIDISSLPSGMYIISVSGEGWEVQRKLIKN